MFKPKHFHMDNYWCRFSPIMPRFANQCIFHAGKCHIPETECKSM